MPSDYEVIGSLNAVQRQVGNAVPSALAEVIALAIRSRLLGEECRYGPLLVPQRRGDMPPSEPVLPVPRKYRHLAGEHSAHPGTGKGNRAVLRTSVS